MKESLQLLLTKMTHLIPQSGLINSWKLHRAVGQQLWDSLWLVIISTCVLVLCSLQLDVNGRVEEETNNGQTRRMKQDPCKANLDTWFQVGNMIIIIR